MNLGFKDKKHRVRESGSALKRYQLSFLHALEGIGYVVKNEHNFIIIIFSIIVTTILGFLLKVNTYEWLFIITCYGLVLGSEMINTAIESTVDLVTQKYETLAKMAKDCASSATLIFSIVSFVGGLIIFIPKL